MRIANSTCEAVAEIDSLPGCSQVAVIHSAFVRAEARNKGIGMKAHLERLEKLWGELNYDAAICTVCSTNDAELKILKAAGWKSAGMTFRSRKTGNYVFVYFRELTRSNLKTYEDYLEEME